MSFMDMISGIGSSIGENPDLFSVLAGTAGSAIAGPDSWQGRLGAGAAQLGQGNIAATEAGKNKQAMLRLLTAALGGEQAPGQTPGTGTPSSDGGLGGMFPALNTSGTQMPSQGTGDLTQPVTAPTNVTAPGGGPAQNPFYQRFFSR